ncbi:MAG TPA: hypothetical protein DEB70_10525, partial [Planctomycetaceae bacterium]|nr:hypothetical protein [Planctomycetaceae bacterium]
MADKPDHVENRNTSLPQDENLKAEAHQSESIVTDLSQQSKKPHFRVLGIVLSAVTLIACVVVTLLPQWLVSASGVRQLIVRSVPNLRGDVFVGAASIG